MLCTNATYTYLYTCTYNHFISMFVTFFRRFSLLKDGGNSRCIVIFLTKDPQLNTKTRFQYNYKKPPNITNCLSYDQ